MVKKINFFNALFRRNPMWGHKANWTKSERSQFYVLYPRFLPFYGEAEWSLAERDLIFSYIPWRDAGWQAGHQAYADLSNLPADAVVGMVTSAGKLALQAAAANRALKTAQSGARNLMAQSLVGAEPMFDRAPAAVRELPPASMSPRSPASAPGGLGWRSFESRTFGIVNVNLDHVLARASPAIRGLSRQELNETIKSLIRSASHMFQDPVIAKYFDRQALKEAVQTAQVLPSHELPAGIFGQHHWNGRIVINEEALSLAYQGNAISNQTMIHELCHAASGISRLYYRFHYALHEGMTEWLAQNFFLRQNGFRASYIAYPNETRVVDAMYNALARRYQNPEYARELMIWAYRSPTKPKLNTLFPKKLFKNIPPWFNFHDYVSKQMKAGRYDQLLALINGL